ncbi:MAG: TraR/DksA C4-type zinc finger protein [Verrucomicrobiota bacterium]
MAAKKTTKKTASKPSVSKAKSIPTAVKKAVAKKVVKKPAASVKKAASAKKPVAKPVAKKVAAAAKKPAAPAKKPVTKALPVKKAAPKATKPEPKKVETKKPEVTKPVAKAVEVKKPEPKKAEPKKVVAKKPSLVSTPPPAPNKPRFVPPKAELAAKPSTTVKGNHSPAFVEKQHQRLLDLRDMLVDSMSGMTRDTIRNAPEGSEASGSGQHQGDAGSDAYDRDFALSVLAKEQDALYEIEQALRRIKSGTYGLCEISELKIPIARLEAIPFARLTVECQAQWEKEYGNRRFRPSDEVGFSGGMPQEDEDSVTVSLDDDDE